MPELKHETQNRKPSLEELVSQTPFVKASALGINLKIIDYDAFKEMLQKSQKEGGFGFFQGPEELNITFSQKMLILTVEVGDNGPPSIRGEAVIKVDVENLKIYSYPKGDVEFFDETISGNLYYFLKYGPSVIPLCYIYSCWP